MQSGHGEWEDPEIRTRCRILWRRPEQLASDIYDWFVHDTFVCLMRRISNNLQYSLFLFASVGLMLTVT